MAISVRHTFQTRLLLTLFSLFILLATYFLSLFPQTNPSLDACFILREHTKPSPTVIPLSDGLLHNSSVYVMWLAMFLLCLLPIARAEGMFTLAYISIWFHVTYILLAGLKVPLDDFNCAGRHLHYPNGISGHYCYFLFVALTAPQYALTRVRKNPKASKVVLAIAAFLMALFTIGGAATLYRTFFHGYHSRRQIALGAVLGILSHVALETLMLREGKEPSMHVSLMLLAANSLTSLTLYARIWPHETAGRAISKGQLVFHCGLWIILGTVAWWRKRSETKVAMD